LGKLLAQENLGASRALKTATDKEDGRTKEKKRMEKT